MGIINILCNVNTPVLVILDGCFLVQPRRFDWSNFNVRFPGCPALPLLLVLWWRVSVNLRLCLLVFLQLCVSPKLKASALSEWIQWSLGLPGFFWNLKVNMATCVLRLSPHEGILRTLDIFMSGGAGGEGGGGVGGAAAHSVHNAGRLGTSGFRRSLD